MLLPNWLNKYRRPKTEIRFLRGQYYLYSVSYKYSKEIKRTKKITGKLLGKITPEEGFIQSDKDKLRDVCSAPIHITEYGAYQLFLSHMAAEAKVLKDIFSPSIDYKSILAIAMMRWIYQSPIKTMEFHWQNSWFRQEWKISLTDKKISELLRQIGEMRENILSFFSYFKKEGEYLLIDTTSIPSRSTQIDSVQLGYSNSNGFTPQTNLFYIFSSILQMPVYYRVVPGNIRDVRSFALSLTESGITDAIIVTDKGFHSRANIELLESSNLRYVIPLRRNNLLISYEPFSTGSKERFTDFFEYEKRIIWYSDQFSEGNRVIIFLDPKLKAEEEQDYLQRTKTHPEEYTKAGFFDKQFRFGTLSCIVNIKNSPEEVYHIYKCRGQIEQVFDTYKNFLEADRTYMQNAKALEGWSFVNFLAIQAYYKLFTNMRQNKMIAKYSPEDIIQISSRMKKCRINNNWVDSEITEKQRNLIAKSSPSSI